jgi:hypothetical protein
VPVKVVDAQDVDFGPQLRLAVGQRMHVRFHSTDRRRIELSQVANP